MDLSHLVLFGNEDELATPRRLILENLGFRVTAAFTFSELQQACQAGPVDVVILASAVDDPLSIEIIAYVQHLCPDATIVRLANMASADPGPRTLDPALVIDHPAQFDQAIQNLLALVN